MMGVNTPEMKTGLIAIQGKFTRYTISRKGYNGWARVTRHSFNFTTSLIAGNLYLNYNTTKKRILWVRGYSTLFLNIFLFITDSKLCSYTNGKTLYTISNNLYRKLRIWSHLLEKSLMENFIFCAVNVTEIKSDINEKFLGVFIDKKLSFDVHIKPVCKEAGQKRIALYSISSYLTLHQRLLLISYTTTV